MFQRLLILYNSMNIEVPFGNCFDNENNLK